MDIGVNIRKYRKNKKLTQEQLADVLNVTVGAVSKWENANSVPDLLLIIEMAKIFNISVDTLVGYDGANRTVAEICENINELKIKDKYEEAFLQAKYALMQYPNNFNILYTVGQLHRRKALIENNSEEKEVAKKLLQESLKYIYQNSNSEINEITIKHDIASVSLDIDESIQILNEINAGGYFNDDLAILYGEKNNIQRALKLGIDYCCSNVSNSLAMALNIIGYYMCLSDFEKAGEICDYIKQILELLRKHDVGYKLDYYVTMVLLAQLIVKKRMGDADNSNDLDMLKTMILDKPKKSGDNFIVGADDYVLGIKNNIKYYYAKKIICYSEYKYFLEKLFEVT